MVKNFLNKKIINQKGFTFVELVVVLGIFAILSSVVLFNFRDFTSSIDLQGLTQEIALQTSNMQRKTLSGSQSANLFFGQGNSRWLPSYGVCFTSGNGCDLSSFQYDPGTAFVLFADNYNDKIYDGSSSPERIDTIEIKGGEYISQICANEGSDCNQDSAMVIYTRPDVSPEIIYGQSSVRDISIEVSSQNGMVKRVIIWKSGQIEVN